MVCNKVCYYFDFQATISLCCLCLPPHPPLLHFHYSSCKTNCQLCTEYTHKRKTSDVNDICTHYHSNRKQTFVQKITENKVFRLFSDVLINLIWNIMMTVKHKLQVCVQMFLHTDNMIKLYSFLIIIVFMNNVNFSGLFLYVGFGSVLL